LPNESNLTTDQICAQIESAARKFDSKNANFAALNLK